MTDSCNKRHENHAASCEYSENGPDPDKRSTEGGLSGFRVQGPGFLKDQMTLKSRGPMPLYYESLYGIRTLNPFRVLFVLEP